MSYRPPGTLRVLRVLAWAAVLRLVRAAKIRRGKRAVANAGPRQPTQRKGGHGLVLLMLVMLPVFAFQALVTTSQAVDRLASAVQEPTREVPAAEAPAPRFGGRRTPHDIGDLLLVPPVTWNAAADRATFLGCGCALLATCLLLLVAIAFGGANANLAGGEWTQAWLMTFPVSTRSLVLARALEYSLVQLLPWLTLFPLTWQLLSALDQAHAWTLAVLGTLTTTVLVGSLRLLLETWLRQRFSLRTLRNLQAAATLLFLVLMATLFRVCLGNNIPRWFLQLGASLPAWVASAPTAWPLAVAHTGWTAALPGALACVVVFALACATTVRLLRRGTMRTGGVDPGRRGPTGARPRRSGRLGILGKDVALLLRDRTFLLQTVGVPIFVIGMQLVVNPSLGDAAGKGLAVLAYGVGAYSLIGGSFQVLSAEGRALWMLFTLPAPIDRMVRQKVTIWAATGSAFAAVALITFTLRGKDVNVPAMLGDLVFVVAGVWAAAHIAAGIGIIGCNPNADYVPRQPKARHVYLFFFFAATFGAGLSGGLPQRIAALLIFATVAYAVWQRASDRLPWLLDPIDDPAPRIGVHDGAAAVLVFFVLQMLTMLTLVGMRGEFGAPDTSTLLLSFAISGGGTVLLFVAMLTLRGIDVAGELGFRAADARRALRSLGTGAAAGLAVGALGLAYLRWVRGMGWVETPPALTPDLGFTLLAVVAAPLVEETLFRGLLLRGLECRVPPAVASVWCAALFASVHPMAGWAPVFLLGFTAALLRQRTGFLPAAMLAHAVYNLVVLWL